ncbi:MAG: FAD-dependent oxidoreductase [Thermodesulfovibrionales bacterium]
MKQHDIIIIGAGISGLSLAHYCAKSGLDTLVLEKNGRTGGTFYSYRLAEDAGFWIELGAHTCYNSYGGLLSIMEECKLLDRILERGKVGYKMLVSGKLKSIPSELNFIELLCSVPHILTVKKEGRTMESYYSSIAGKRNFDRVFGPALSAVISQKANDFPAAILFKKRPHRKDIRKNFTLAGGLQTITDSIAAQPDIRFESAKEVKTVTFSDDLFSVVTGDGTGYESRSLALATPASAAAELSRTSFPELSSVLSRIKIAVSDAVGVVVRKDKVSLSPLAGIIPASDSFYSVVSRDVIPHNEYRGFTFHFKPGLIDRDAKLTRIAEVLGIGELAIECVITTENLVPFLSVGHERLLGEIDAQLTGKKILVTGNYLLGLAIEDCVLRSRSEFSRLKSLLKRDTI